MAVSNRCFYPGQLLLPREGTNLTAWACVACDQFTSQPAYWEEVERLVGDQPSAFRMILPECWLNETDARVPGICRTMCRSCSAPWSSTCGTARWSPPCSRALS